MAHITADRVRQTSTSIGTGSIVLSGSIASFRDFSAVLAVNDTFWYAIASYPGSEWEVGLGTYTSASTFTRTTVLSSSNAGAAVTFSAGTKEVFITSAASKFLQADAAGSYGNFTAGTITAALTGNASTATSVGSLTGIATVAPLAAGAAAVGTSTLGARQDHVHPAQTTVSGNAGTATALATSRTLWGQAFTGAANVTGSLTSVADIQQDNATYLKGKLAAGTATRLFGLNASDTLYIGSVDVAHTGSTLFVKGGAEQMRIDSAGLVGIGGSPIYKLDVQDSAAATIRARTTSSGNAGLIASTAAGGAAYCQLTNAAGDHYIYGGVGGTQNLSFVVGSERMRIDSSGNVVIGATSTTYKLQVVGSFAATTKSFVIPHPTKEGKQLRYGSLEGPENGVYVRGRLKDNDTIELPEYWTGLVDEDSITINITPIGKHQKLYVESIKNNIVIIGNENLLNKSIDCFYTVFAERKDVEKLKVEI